MSTFFPVSSLQMATDTAIKVEKPKCGRCGLHARCRSAKLAPVRKGRVLFVGESPSEDADRTGRLMPSRQDDQGLLHSVIKDAGLDNSDWSYITALACRPPEGRVEAAEVDFCRPSVINWIRQNEPAAVVLLGAYAVRSVIGGLWKDVSDPARFVGFEIPDQQVNAWIVPTYSPAFAAPYKNPVMKALLARHVARAAALSKERPWKEPPRYEKQVRVELDQHKAAETVRGLIGKRPVAFDYETNCLKPDSARALIVCYSVSDGRTTLATPFTPVTRKALRDLVTSGTPMIASNMKFEDRWTRAKLGCSVKTWALDTMLASHVLDNRPGINSIKFQSYVLLGQKSYDEHIKPYLKSKTNGGYDLNQIHRVNVQDLLLYCGLDSLLEWEVAKIQSQKMKGASR